jgi:hypothetical protein
MVLRKSSGASASAGTDSYGRAAWNAGRLAADRFRQVVQGMEQRMSATSQLADALDRSTITPSALARKADIPTRIAANAICGRPVATVSYLKICRAIDFDPAPMLKMESGCGPDFDFSYLGMGLKMRRGLNKHNDRQAAKAIGVGASTICRAERGEPMQIGVTLGICAYIGVHPFGYMRESFT